MVWKAKRCQERQWLQDRRGTVCSPANQRISNLKFEISLVMPKGLWLIRNLVRMSTRLVVTTGSKQIALLTCIKALNIALLIERSKDQSPHATQSLHRYQDQLTSQAWFASILTQARLANFQLTSISLTGFKTLHLYRAPVPPA